MRYDLPKFVSDALFRLRVSGFSSYVVGGSVRDLLLQRVPGDYDIATAALPAQVEAVFREQKVLPTGMRHGTVTLLTDDAPLEITTFRVDGLYTDHRRPDAVAFSESLQEDLARRDFTINAMALSEAGEVIDPFGGQADLSAGIIRCVGDPVRRFAEDALRILRALRFASRYRFCIETETAAALLNARVTLAHIAKERVLSELCGMDFAFISPAFLPVLRVPIPELIRLSVPEGLPPVVEIRLAALLQGLPALGILGRLKASRFLQTRVAQLVEEASAQTSPDASSVRSLLHRVGEEAARQTLLLQQNQSALQTLETVLKRGDCYRLDQLAITGRDLTTLGFSGPAVGSTLNSLLNAVIRGQVTNTRAALLAQCVKRQNSP